MMQLQCCARGFTKDTPHKRLSPCTLKKGEVDGLWSQRALRLCPPKAVCDRGKLLNYVHKGTTTYPHATSRIQWVVCCASHIMPSMQ